MRVIVLLTDFGHQDAYVGVMHGVIASVSPGAKVIDLCHEVEPQAVADGAFLLAASAPYFPPETVFVAVVDPGVGSERRVLCARTAQGTFLAPDNGLLTDLLRASPPLELVEVRERRFFLSPVSHTFHGRDVFAPVGARLVEGLALSELGPAVTDYVRLDLGAPGLSPEQARGEVRYVDRFGNLITNISSADLPEVLHATLGERVIPGPIRTNYASVAPGEALLIAGSSGFVEVSVCRGSALRVLKTKLGATLELALRREEGS
ncbi:MAG: SAM-dependent chlorinase/fluorinase [Planctomycetes bacterium]|nr:SAM-dependent chlorinase/fluorinase [Planctomycetota bacterium]